MRREDKRVSAPRPPYQRKAQWWARFAQPTLRPHRRQSRHGRKTGLAGIAAHDGLALRITQHVLDIIKTVGRQLLYRVDHALGAATAVRTDDLRRHRQPLLL